MKWKIFNENKYLKRLEKTLKFHELYKFDNKKIQKCKFKLISELVHDLFKYKNCRDCFINISNLIILFLTVFEKDSPFDIYSGYDDEFELIDEDVEYRNILREEFNGFL
jgi:hypothetical protein